MIELLLVDDQPLIRSGLRHVFEHEDDLSVVAEAGDGGEALEALARVSVDVVVMDVRMRGMDGIEATTTIRDADGPPVLVLTTFDDDDILWGAINAGAGGFVLKEAPPEDLVRAVRTIASGGAWLDPAVTPRVLEFSRGVGPVGESVEHGLTERELEVLSLVAQAATNGEIAEQLYVGSATVKTHVSSIFSKLGVRDRAGAIVFAYRHGLVDYEPRP